MVDTSGAVELGAAEANTDKNRGNADTLRRYWTHGEGAAHIIWGTPGDFDRCVVQLVEHGHMTTDQAQGYCAERHHDATGQWPSQHGKPPRKPSKKSKESEVPDAREAAAAAPYGDVEYADAGYQQDGKQRYPIDTAAHVRSAWSYISKPANAAKYSKGNLNRVRAAIKRAARKLGVAISDPATEAMIAGRWSYGDVRDMVRDAVRDRIRQQAGGGYAWCSVIDLTDSDVVYADDLDCDDLWQCSYTMDTAGAVTLGDASRVVRTYAPAPAGMPADPDAQPDPMDDMAEAAASAPARVQVASRLLEAKPKAADGGRVFGIRVIAYGDSRNGRRYSEAVMRAAAPQYEGARVFDHHRTDEELRTSTITGLVGHIENVTATADGLEADLHLFPSATRAAEALDASLAAQEAGRPPLVGISHDVMAQFRPLQGAGRTKQDTTAITAVNSADIVAVPAAGGQALRAVAGGEQLPEIDVITERTEETDVPVTPADVLAALKEARDDELAAVGLARATVPSEPTNDDGDGRTGEAASAGEPKAGFLGQLMIREKVTAAGLPAKAVEAATTALPERIAEADVDAWVAGVKAALGVVDIPVPGTTAQVTQESQEKKVAALDAFFAQDFAKGYRSFREAFIDFTGRAPRAFDEDFNRVILRESIRAEGYDSARAARATESADSTTWNLVLGDSITRRMVAEYNQPNLRTWQAIVSSTIPVNDFRTQRIDRIGGYGTLPPVNQGAPYQPLTTPTNEEVTYAVTKRGGTEDVTLEMIANDDVRAISRIPGKLGLAAAQTLFRFVWDILDTNPNIYDGNALFTVGGAHANSAATALSQSALSTARTAMRSQAAYGDTSDILSLVPRTLIVVNELEELAFQLCTSAVAIPATPAGPSDTPNIHQGLTPIVVDYWASTTKWIIVADPAMCPTFELGFYQGRQDPELFTQSDPSVGSAFDADKVTWKIRHIYSGAVLDYRGFQRGNV